MFVLIAIICAIFLYFCLDIITFIDNISYNRNCTFKVNGKIVDMWTEERYIRNRNFYLPYKIFRTKIVIEYMHNNQTYSITKRVPFYKPYKVFDNVELFINPNNAEEVGKFKVDFKPRELTKTDKWMKILMLSALILSLIPIALIIIFIIFDV